MGFIPEFDIELPSWLDWVRPLLQWPVGSETQWWGRARALRDAAAKAEALEPELAGARAHTAAVLVGETGQAVDRQYAKVFGGDASLPKSVDALEALADTAEGLGDQIQANKLGNIGLAAWAAYQLARLAASAVFTGGASEAEVPVVEAMTEAASREIAEQGAEEVAGSLLRVAGTHRGGPAGGPHGGRCGGGGRHGGGPNAAQRWRAGLGGARRRRRHPVHRAGAGRHVDGVGGGRDGGLDRPRRWARCSITCSARS